MKSQDATLPPDLISFLAEAQELARVRNMPVERLLRNALDSYLSSRWLDEANAYGRRKAKELGITEQDVERLIDEYRREQRDASLH